MLTELIELGQKMKDTQNEKEQNIQGTNSDRKKTRTQSNDLEQKEKINIQPKQNEETRLQKSEEREREEHRYEKTATRKYLSIITLNVNGLNASIKRHRIAEWIRMHDPHICCLQETHLRTKDLHRMKVKTRNIYSKKMDRKKMG